ncbi:acetate non-utilizing protein 9 [Microsporum canis CBS 113480]|uniref:Succinate dehydrogenase assembly factor 3 n=1 Tax=Arthroderma otae (strain ATCC MYA-4605 / CBS 113480) TaxID=554155 RepID=C5FP43_ARTOC|nr:acetate non-utilizing protein 9 [Microsporum canis CBS 113480]EEQ31896.1 acetate non-utilizing protein 9 [Microsporum canis CBS 113480]
MRASLPLRLASSSSIPAGSGLRQTPMALLPPIPLYRRLLRAHRRKLPADLRFLGDSYVKSEFRAHRNVENPIHIIGFLTEWQLYAQQLEGDSWADGKLDKAKIDKMSDQQIGQLYELMQTIKSGDGDGSEGDS